MADQKSALYKTLPLTALRFGIEVWLQQHLLRTRSLRAVRKNCALGTGCIPCRRRRRWNKFLSLILIKPSAVLLFMIEAFEIFGPLGILVEPTDSRAAHSSNPLILKEVVSAYRANLGPETHIP